MVLTLDEHRQFEIYSVSVSPDGKRLASGGLDGKVRIWSTDAVYSSIKSEQNTEAAVEPPAGRQLCSMSNHNGGVTVVRFSPNGKYLASGSDDRVVLIWEQDDTRIPRKEFGQQEADSEAWVARKRLTGHENDVQDLAWAPDGSILVTVGLDSSIIVWSGQTFEKLKVLDAHQSHVKGVTFDPANKYFVTASDDRTMRVVRYHRTSATDITFSIEASISAPFKGSPLSTYFRRCSWSPDGNHIAAANATNGPLATVAIINRGKWDSDISLVGHDAPCEVASFCPRVFTVEQPRDRPAAEDANTITVIATASQDKSLAIWSTLNPRPLLVASNVAAKTITDISWSPDGSKLFACSLDGTMLVASFEPGELGWPLSAEEVDKELTRYGGTKDAMQIPESVEQIDLEERISKTEKPAEKKMDQIMGNSTDGFREATAGGTPSPAPAGSTTGSTTGSAAATAAGSVPESTTSANTSAPASAPAPATSTSSVPSALNTPAPSKPVQKVTITKEGKKRVAPQLLTTQSQASQPRTLEQMPATTIGPIGSTESSIPVMDMSKPSYALPKGGVSALTIGTKRKHDDEEDEGATATATAPKKSKYEEVPEFIKPAVVSPASTVSQVRLAVPKVRTFVSHGDTSGTAGTVLEIRNGNGTEQEPTRVVATKKGQVVFVDFLPRYGHLAAGSESDFWAVATEDGVIYLYSPTGRRLMPSIVLGASVTFLESQGAHLLAITSTGIMQVWNVKQQRAMHGPVSVAPILDSASKYSDNGVLRAPSITQCGVTASGKVVITLSNGQGYTYHHDMQSWHRISESWWTIGSRYWDTSGTRAIGNNHGGVVNMVERRTNEEVIVKGGSRGRQLQRMAKNRMMQEGYEGFEGVVSIAHLENRIGAAVLLDSPDELRQNLAMYARLIAEEGMKDRVQELCSELLGPLVYRRANGGGQWAPTICGIDKRQLLRQVIDTIGKYREVQRVVVDFDHALASLESDQS